MQIAFEHAALKKQCEKPSVAQRAFGVAGAKKLARRLNELSAAEKVGDLVVGHPHPLKGNRAGQFSLNLHGGCRLVFKANHLENPVLADGGINWPVVSKISIVFIGDYHD